MTWVYFTSVGNCFELKKNTLVICVKNHKRMLTILILNIGLYDRHIGYFIETSN
jgi:hypothetical protein